MSNPSHAPSGQEPTTSPKQEGDALDGMPRKEVQRAIQNARAQLTKAEHTLAAIQGRGVFYRIAERNVRMKRAVLAALLPFADEVDAGYNQ